MSCYFRHLKEILDEAGVAVTPDNKKQIDRAIHQIVGTSYKDCPATWKKIKQQVIANKERKEEFVNALKYALK